MSRPWLDEAGGFAGSLHGRHQLHHAQRILDAGGAAASGSDAGHGGRGVLIAQEASQTLPQIISSVFATRE